MQTGAINKSFESLKECKSGGTYPVSDLVFFRAYRAVLKWNPIRTVTAW